MMAAQHEFDFRPRTIRQAKSAGAEGLKRVTEHADPAWLEHAMECIHKVCLAKPDFIGDNIWDQGLDHTPFDRALGSCIVKAARLGWCEKTKEYRASRLSNGSPKPVWKSLLWKGTL
jgi:hypothetical protein